MITLGQLVAALFPPQSNRTPTPEQAEILRHPNGPAWVLAGPGSGKTEVLALFALRLMYVGSETFQKEPVAPRSILITTFTEKAAKNLEDRIGRYRATLIEAHPELGSVDISDLKVGTLHGLCNDLLQEHRATSYQNVRLMDEFEQAMFVYEHVSAVKGPDDPADHAFWSSFEFLFGAKDWQASRSYLPAKWHRTGALVKLFNRIAEDRVSVAAMYKAGAHWRRVADLYDEYCQHLKNNHRCDFSQLQVHFLDFLKTNLGKSFLKGSPGAHEGIRWVLVDEYQDTNLVQEAIYFEMAGHHQHNLVVVGDDDQALYRFRGGSVECMVTFDQACQVHLNVQPSSVAKYPLAGNFRSHPDIVKFFNEYIAAFPSMKQVGARVPNKKAMTARSGISGNYPAVGILEGKKTEDMADRFANAIKDLVDKGVVNDPSQCCLLLNSTKESPRNAGPYVEALKRVGLQVYNPRNKAFLEQEEVQGLLGALLAMVDPTGQHMPTSNDLHEFIEGCRDTYAALANAHPKLRGYVRNCVDNIAAHPGKFVDTSLQEIAYLLLSCPPFDQWHNDPVRRVRLARLTSLLESYASMPVLGHAGVQRGRMKVDDQHPHAVVGGWAMTFYHLFFGYLAKSGLDEVGDDDVICPPGYVPVMTIHQAKGLEFPFVFVANIRQSTQVGDAHNLESEMAAFPGNPHRTFKLAQPETRAELDRIRQFYVAYSRAQYALILVGSKTQVANADGKSVPCGPSKGWLSQRLINL